MNAYIVEIRPQVYAVVLNGHALRQHYFTRPAALAAAGLRERIAR